MLVVKVELHSATTGRVTEIGRVIIANDDTGTDALGNYDVKQAREGDQDNSSVWHGPEQAARVLAHRRSRHVWELVSRSLQALGFGVWR